MLENGVASNSTGRRSRRGGTGTGTGAAAAIGLLWWWWRRQGDAGGEAGGKLGRGWERQWRQLISRGEGHNASGGKGPCHASRK